MKMRKVEIQVDEGSTLYLVYAGSEKIDLGPKRAVAVCTSKTQAETLINGMWPGLGYWELT